jgi:hypothetical protein
MKRIVFNLLLFSMLTSSSCNNSSEKNVSVYSSNRLEICKCRLNINEPREVLDSTQNILEGEIDINPSIRFELPEKIKKFMELELNLEYEKKGRLLETKTVVKRIIDKFPEITNFTSLKKEFYCEFIHNICADTTLTNKEIIDIKNQRLEEIDNLFEKIYLEKILYTPKHGEGKEKKTSTTIKSEGSKESQSSNQQPSNLPSKIKIKGSIYDSFDKPLGMVRLAFSRYCEDTITDEHGIFNASCIDLEPKDMFNIYISKKGYFSREILDVIYETDLKFVYKLKNIDNE